MSIQCPTCFASNLDQAQFCTTCGSPLMVTAQKTIPMLGLHLPPKTLLHRGRYRIETVLGEGGFGITYRGIDLDTQSIVAIKEFRPEKSARQGNSFQWSHQISPRERQEQIQKVLDEGENLKKCAHPNIAKFFDCFEENQTAYIVMEFIAGQSLAAVLYQAGKLSEARVRRYVLQLINALKVVHAQNLLHRDIKPHNIIITANDQAMLIDFGSARAFIAGKTNRMTTFLTPGYAPPEQYATKARRGPSTDFYALSAAMYESLTGRVPEDALDRQNQDPLTPPSQLLPSIDPMLEQVILIGLNLDARERYQTAEEFEDALQNGVFPSLRQARQLVAQSLLSEARPKYQRAIADYERCSKDMMGIVMTELLVVLAHLDDPLQAEAIAQTALQLRPQDGTIPAVLGLFACRHGNGAQAVQLLTQAVRLSPHQAWIEANFAWAHSLAGNERSAIASIDRALALDPQLSFALGLKAWLAAKNSDWKTTITMARRSLWQSTDRLLPTWVYPCLIVALDQAVNDPQAPDLDRALQEFSDRCPHHPFIAGFAGWKQASQFNLAEAIAQFDSAGHHSTAPGWVLYNLGVVYEQAGNRAAAIKAYKACQHDPDYAAVANFRIGTVLGQQSQWTLAQLHLEKAANGAPHHAEAHHNLGWVLLNLRDNDGCVANPSAVRMAYLNAMKLYERAGNVTVANQIRLEFQAIGILTP